ncbi:MAG: DUF1254 domain-containing protein [Bdellovibrio sp.]|nr:DUF1254 domain-containing protein [Bdellovibrio sp.]
MKLLRDISLAFIVMTSLGSNSWAQNQTSDKSYNKMAVEAVIWGTPLVTMDAMRQAYFRDAKAKYNDIVYLARDWKNQVTTPNSSSIYLYFNYNTTHGPTVIEIPAAQGGGIFGSIENAWQRPLADFGPKGEDAGKGAKYLVLPPGYSGPVPAGYIKVPSDTYNGYSVIRAIPLSNSAEDNQKVMALANKVRVYQLSQSVTPPKQKFIDMRERLFDGIARYDSTFFSRLSAVINEEPILEGDRALMEKFKMLGLEKGKDLAIGERKADFSAAAGEAQNLFKKEMVNAIVPWTERSHWGQSPSGMVGAKTGFSFKKADGIDHMSRAVTYYMACAPPKKLGEASVYIGGFKDAQGVPFDGNNTYQLTVPANVPAEQFWAVNVYDLDTAGFIRNSPKVGVDSYNPKLVKNPNGTVDIFFGAKPPMGKEPNWIYTAPGRNWFAFFRMYGPKPGAKNWRLPDIEKIPTMPQAQAAK